MKKNFAVAVVGGGPAGIAAAVRASESGRPVALVDDNPAPGGQIWRSGAPLTGSAQRWLARLDASPVVWICGARVFDHPAAGVLAAEQNEEEIEIGYEQLILATGARELFLPFPGWTLPGVFGAGGLDAMARCGLPVRGKRIAVAGTGPLLLAVAAHLAQRGAKIVAICEQTRLARVISFAAGMGTQPRKLLQGLGYAVTLRGGPLHFGCWPVEAHGEKVLEAVTFRQGERVWSVDCDYLAYGFHLVPNIELAQLVGCRVDAGFVVTDQAQRTSVADIYCAGELTGIGGVELALVEGQIAGLAATGRVAKSARFVAQRQKMLRFVDALRKTYALDPELRRLATDETIVCRCEDVSYGALRARTSWRDAKLQTRCGMGPCQGRICGSATEFLFGWKPDSVRPPIFPALVSSLAVPGNVEEEA